MNESIGEKGKKRDHKRRLLISKNIKDKLEKQEKELTQEELKCLEKKVKKQQIITFLKVIPVVTLGGIVKTLTAKTKEEVEVDNLNACKKNLKETNTFSEEQSAKLEELIDNKKEIIELSKEEPKDETITVELEENKIIEINPTYSSEIKEYTKKEYEEKEKITTIAEEITKQEETIEKIKETVKEEKPREEEQKEEQIIVSVLPKLDEDELTKHQEETLEQLKNKAIVTEYEKDLKETRKELRDLEFEYNALSEETAEISDTKQADEMLDKLNTLIDRIEALKDKIDITNYDKYDNNYLYCLVEDSLNDFKNQIPSGAVKDSSLYILLSQKLDELDDQKIVLKEKISDKKDSLQIDESKLEEIKNKYYNFENFNNELLKFQNEQDAILKDINSHLNTVHTAEQEVTYKVHGMYKQNRRLMQLMHVQMALPGARSSKGIAASVLTSLYFMKNVMKPRTLKRKYKVLATEDFSKEIESNMSQLNNISELLSNTTVQIDKVISEFKNNYKDYLDTIPECRKLLNDLEKVKAQIKEKEYELNRIKQEQQKSLEKNNAKVMVLS